MCMIVYTSVCMSAESSHRWSSIASHCSSSSLITLMQMSGSSYSSLHLCRFGRVVLQQPTCVSSPLRCATVVVSKDYSVFVQEPSHVRLTLPTARSAAFSAGGVRKYSYHLFYGCQCSSRSTLAIRSDGPSIVVDCV